MLNDFLTLFLGAYDALISREFSDWYFVRAVLAVAVLVILLMGSLACVLYVVKALCAWLRPGGDSKWL